MDPPYRVLRLCVSKLQHTKCRRLRESLSASNELRVAFECADQRVLCGHVERLRIIEIEDLAGLVIADGRALAVAARVAADDGTRKKSANHIVEFVAIVGEVHLRLA